MVGSRPFVVTGNALQDVDVRAGLARVRGRCAAEFEAVLQAFVANFVERDEEGASLCVNVAGETRVDLWGGFTGRADGSAAWTADTLSVVFSCTKGATALCAHVLVDRGALDLNAPVATYWPEFATPGKEEVTVRMMLDHTAGVPAVREPVRKGGFLDWDYMTARLAAEDPFWPPGTRNGYHMATFGWTVGELVRRVSGRSLGTFFREEIAEPLGLDFWIGLPDAHHHRVGRMIPWTPDRNAVLPAFTRALQRDFRAGAQSLQFLALLNTGGHRADDPASYRAELGAGGGVANARALAGMYAPLANGGGGLVSTDHLVRMSEVAVATEIDATLLMPTRFGLGFMRSMDNRHRPGGAMESMILGREAFGHAGAGGSVGFADPSARLAFGYTMNRMGAGVLLNARGQALVDATYRVLGHRTDAPGVWVR
jgi:CubicO group peptidase (beta-lactamase class C family)